MNFYLALPFRIYLLLAAAVALAFEPARWLLRSWYAPGYEGIGVAAFLVVVALFVRSWRSPLQMAAQSNSVKLHNYATRRYLLLLCTAGIRLLSQILDINLIGALLLCVDVYALATLARLHQREFSVSPVYLALLFVFCLPIEPVMQRVLGFGLQNISANIACALLSPWFADLSCEGVRIQLAGTDVLVDLPCSGSVILSLSGLAFAALCTVARPGLRHFLFGLASCLCLAFLANGARIALLAIGIAFRDALSFDVMDTLPHTIIGLLMVGLVSLGLLACFKYLGAGVEGYEPDCAVTPETLPKARNLLHTSAPRLKTVFAFLFFCLALIIGTVTPQPLDATAPAAAPTVPLVAGGYKAVLQPLNKDEQRYFTNFGGNASRASYGPYGLLLVETASPLRHLHDPAVCLSGMGLKVKFLGTDHQTRSAIYQAKKPGTAHAESYLIHVSYRSISGRLASSIAEVVWLWLRTDNDESTERWTMVQRLIPEHASIDAVSAAAWEASIRRAFNLYKEV